jgi:hypothetical protein
MCYPRLLPGGLYKGPLERLNPNVAKSIAGQTIVQDIFVVLGTALIFEHANVYRLPCHR